MTLTIDMQTGAMTMSCDVCSVSRRHHADEDPMIRLSGRTNHEFCSRECLEKWLAKRKARI